MKGSEEKGLVPYSTIVAATQGDVLAVEAVLQHYSGYISTLSTQAYFDCYGNVEFYVDEIIRQRVKIKLITSILKFKVS